MAGADLTVTQGRPQTMEMRGWVAKLQGQVFEEDVPEGGYAVISAFLGQEYKGLITSKTKLMTWNSDELHTSNGVPVKLTVAVLWRIGNRHLYFSKISDEFHQGSDILDHVKIQPGAVAGLTQQGEVAELWIRTLAAGTLRQQLSHLPAERVVSAHVEDFMLRPLMASGDLALVSGTEITPNTLRAVQQRGEQTATHEAIHRNKGGARRQCIPDVLRIDSAEAINRKVGHRRSEPLKAWRRRASARST